MFEIRRYTPADAEAWNGYVRTARNATFLFFREYMDYHSDRFHDHSLMFYKGKRLYALLPAHQEQDTLCSHFGLTYGGLIMSAAVTVSDTCVLFDELNIYLRQAGFRHVKYRPIPWIYHQLPSEEDLYAIFHRCNARLSLRNIGTTIFLQQPLQWRKDHRRRLRQALSAGVTVVADASIPEFWEVLTANLQERYAAKPVHSIDEIMLLKRRFPEQIVQYSAYRDGHIIGGLTLYVTPQVIHGQYSATNDEGKSHGAMEAIYNQLMYQEHPSQLYLDFGSSTEDQGRWINGSLIAHKEGFGGRGVVYDTYEWDL